MYLVHVRQDNARTEVCVCVLRCVYVYRCQYAAQCLRLSAYARVLRNQVLDVAFQARQPSQIHAGNTNMFSRKQP